MSDKKPSFEMCKYGVFVHIVAGLSIRSDGKLPETLDDFADNFDVEGFADAIARMRVQYLVVTSWHYKMRPLYPSEVTEKWRPGNSVRRDLLGDIIDAANERGIAVILYTHPRDGHDFEDDEKIAMGWGLGTDGRHNDVPNALEFKREIWNRYATELYCELADRYANKLLAFYTDGVGSYSGKDTHFENNLQIVDYLSIRDIMKSRNPEIIMIQNYFGNIFSNDFAMPEGYFGYEDIMNMAHTEKWPAANKALAICPFGGGWMPSADFVGKDARKMTLEDMLKYTMFDASATSGGGLCWACSPYAEGNVWQTGVLESMSALGDELSRLSEGFYNARPSRSYPTLSGDTLEGKDYTFFMSSDDGKYEYLHLMKEKKVLFLGNTEDGAQLLSPVSLCGGVKIESFEKNENGYTLLLSGEFDRTDTVIRFERVGGVDAPRISFINDTDKRVRYEGEWKYCHLVGNKGEEGLLPHGCFEGDYHRTESAGASLFLAFEGDVIEIYGNLRKGNSSAGVYIDGIELGSLCTDSETAQNRVLIFRSGERHGGWHTLYIVNRENKTFEFDVIVHAVQVTSEPA